MKTLTRSLLIAAALAAPAAAGDLSVSDAAALSAHSDPSLAAFSAAATPARSSSPKTGAETPVAR